MSDKYRMERFYVHDVFKPIMDKFDEICRREGVSSSKKIRDLIAEYVRVHEPGNPQKRLDVVLEEGGAKGPVCGVCDQPAYYECWYQGTHEYRCKPHLWEGHSKKVEWGYRELHLRPPGEVPQGPMPPTFHPGVSSEVTLSVKPPICVMCGQPGTSFKWLYVTSRRRTQRWFCEAHTTRK